ncbi:hypothetical protein HYX18_00295 [Candidatus Woesearchaeota archaeon]|nr:hypothetical protein [Candidatus Woesearchaeota archaeon]
MIPKEEELLKFIEKHDNLVNISMIASFFNIKNATASDLVNDIAKKKLIEIKKLGGSKIIRVIKK